MAKMVDVKGVRNSDERPLPKMATWDALYEARDRGLKVTAELGGLGTALSTDEREVLENGLDEVADGILVAADALRCSKHSHVATTLRSLADRVRVLRDLAANEMHEIALLFDEREAARALPVSETRLASAAPANVEVKAGGAR